MINVFGLYFAGAAQTWKAPQTNHPKGKDVVVLGPTNLICFRVICLFRPAGGIGDPPLDTLLIPFIYSDNPSDSN